MPMDPSPALRAGCLLQAAAALAAAACLAWSGAAAAIAVAPDDNLQHIIDQAPAHETLTLASGVYAGNLRIDKPLTLQGPPDRSAIIQGDGSGRSIAVQAPNVTLRNLTVRGSGMRLFEMDAAIFLDKPAHDALVEHNDILGNLMGVYVWGPNNAMVRSNRIVGDTTLRMAERGNGVQLWNTPGTQVIDNDISLGRDGIFVNTSKRNRFVGNRFRDLRFAIHYMYTQDSEIIGNVAEHNDIGYALMFSDRLVIRDNVARDNREHGLMLNSVTRSTITGNFIRYSEKCTFLYGASLNTFRDNWFQDCQVGIHFTAGSERNKISDNAFVDNQTQIRYVSTRHLDWSENGRGNYWSDNTAFDLNGDGIADTAYRPNGIMDQVLWRAPMAKLLLNSPATQVVKWAQSQFPALLPGGVVDSSPLMTSPEHHRNSIWAKDTIAQPLHYRKDRNTATTGNGINGIQH